MDEPAVEGHKIVELPTVHKAYLVQQTYGTNTVTCGVCARGCSVPEGRRGSCGTRLNFEGQLYTMTYGDVVASESGPVEAMPFFHFHPGSTVLSISAASCNMSCPWCDNPGYSRVAPRPLAARHVPMREIVQQAAASGDAGICVSMGEPLMLFEYCLGLFREAGAKKMPCLFVTNGYMTSDALHMLTRAGLSAMSVGVKGSDSVYRDHCGVEAGARPAWETVRNAIEMGVHVEVVHRVVASVNDDASSLEEIVHAHLEHAGPAVPLHLDARAAGAAPTGFLEEARATARDAGVEFVYARGPGSDSLEDTRCPACGATVIERRDGRLTADRRNGGNCQACCGPLPVVG